MSANTSPDNITYPTSGDAVSPLETVFATQAASVQAALTSFRNTKLSLVVADLTALAAVTGMSSGQLAIVTEGGAVWEYNGTTWVQQTIAQFATTSARDTAYAKASGVYLTAWTAQVLITGTGQNLQYNGSAWTNPFTSGLMPIIPTSVAGTGVSVSGTGVVTFTAATAVSLNGCFNSTYDNYLVLIDIPTKSAGGTLQFRFRLAGTDDSTASGYTAQVQTNTTTVVSTAQVVTTAGTLNSNGATVEDSVKATFFGPALARVTRWHAEYFSVISSILGGLAYGRHTQVVAYDGITILSTPTITGTIRVYGYLK